MQTGFSRRFLALAVSMLLAIATVIALNLLAARQLRADVVELDRVAGVQSLTRALLTTLLDTEISRRGAPSAAAPRDPARDRAGPNQLAAQLDELTVAVANDREQAAAVARLRALLDAKPAGWAAMDAPPDARPVGAAPGPLPADRDPVPMDRIRTVLAELEAAESAALAQRLAARDASLERNNRYRLLLVAACGVLLLALVVLVRREQALRQRLKRADDEARQTLERRVAQRTAALDAALHSVALNEGRLRGIFDAAADAILTVDASQQVVQANPAAARLFRCAAGDLVGAPLERLIPARLRETHRRDVQAFGSGEAQARRMAGGREVVGLRADGEEFPAEAGISHAVVDGERLYTVILRDITQRRRADAALRESKGKLESALASINDAVFIVDTEGRLVDFNDAFVAFHRFRSRDECRQRLQEYPPIIDVLTADGTPLPVDQWPVSRALRGEKATNLEYALRRKDTGRCWVGSYSFAPIPALDGGIAGAVVTGRDITEIRRVQADLAASHAELQRLVDAQHRVQEEERKRIARELHDDLQQSLAAIRMDAVAIGERVASGRDDLQGLLARIDRLSAAAIDSTRRIVSGLRPELLEDLGLVPALQALCAQHAARTGAACRFEVLPDGVATQLDDSPAATGLYRIAQEALNNVAKHARATTVDVRLDGTHEGLLILRVSDDGVGLVRRDRRAPASFGLLGMAERMRAMGGQLRVEGRTGAGTTVEALIPALGLVAGAALDGGAPAAGGDGSAAAAPLVVDIGPASLHEELGRPLQDVLDAVPGNAAVLDRHGTVRWVNRAWRAFAARHEAPALQGCGPGADYLAVCRRSADADAATKPVLAGLQAVLKGPPAVFTTEYPCPTSDGRRWFRLHAAAVTGGLVIVTHIDLTRSAEGVAVAEPAAIVAAKDAPA